MSENSKSVITVNFTGLLFIVFLVLKLTHVIDWSWWWVTAPLWGIPALVIAVELVALFVSSIILLIEYFLDR